MQRFADTFAARMLTAGGALHWRIVMLIFLLAAIGWPLRSALRQLTGEAVAREAVQSVVRKLVPAADEVSRQVEVGSGSIAVRLVATEELSDTQVQQAEQEIERRTGRKTNISVASVASQSELAGLMQRLAAPVALPPPPPPKIVPLADVRDDLLARVKPALTAVWPAGGSGAELCAVPQRGWCRARCHLRSRQAAHSNRPRHSAKGFADRAGIAVADSSGQSCCAAEDQQRDFAHRTAAVRGKTLAERNRRTLGTCESVMAGMAAATNAL